MQTISAQAHSKSSPHEVWALLADTSSWARWAPFDHAGLEEQGSPESEGVGAIRRFRARRRTTRERVVVFEPPTRFGYELLSGIPIRNYRAEVTLRSADDGGTLIQWESRFEGQFPIPGSLIKRKLDPLSARQRKPSRAQPRSNRPKEARRRVRAHGRLQHHAAPSRRRLVLETCRGRCRGRARRAS
jgi:hypothetical protein